MSNKTDAAFHGSTLRDELLRAAPFSDDEGLLRRAAERIAELEQTQHPGLAHAWAVGHEVGFWNGRESAGSGEMDLVGVDHARAVNPYRNP